LFTSLDHTSRRHVDRETTGQGEGFTEAKALGLKFSTLYAPWVHTFFSIENRLFFLMVREKPKNQTSMCFTFFFVVVVGQQVPLLNPLFDVALCVFFVILIY